jgi:hypothetical protein
MVDNLSRRRNILQKKKEKRLHNKKNYSLYEKEEHCEYDVVRIINKFKILSVIVTYL